MNDSKVRNGSRIRHRFHSDVLDDFLREPWLSLLNKLLIPKPRPPKIPLSKLPPSTPLHKHPTSFSVEHSGGVGRGNSTAQGEASRIQELSFNVGGGGSLSNGTTATYVRGGGPIGPPVLLLTDSKYFGFRLDFQWDDLPLCIAPTRASSRSDELCLLV